MGPISVNIILIMLEWPSQNINKHRLRLVIAIPSLKWWPYETVAHIVKLHKWKGLWVNCAHAPFGESEVDTKAFLKKIIIPCQGTQHRNVFSSETHQIPICTKKKFQRKSFLFCLYTLNSTVDMVGMNKIIDGTNKNVQYQWSLRFSI